MPSFGKKILSAFVDLSDEEKQPEAVHQPPVSHAPAESAAAPEVNSKFSEHFNKLFADANLPGPDYYEFSKMTEAMQAIADEKARYCAAFAGLQVQGLSKGKLLSSAMEYVQILEADAVSFHNTIDAALSEKVQSRKKEMAEASERIQKLSQEIVTLQQHMDALTKEIAENEAKIEHSAAGYSTAMEYSKHKLLQDIEKIKVHIL
jgi:hypothetical protein